MTFKVIDKKTGKEPTSRVIRNIAKEGGLMIMDIDQFFVGEYGSLVLADQCGNIAYCDTKRFKVIAEQEPIILRVNEKHLEELKELMHDNPLCVAMAEPKRDLRECSSCKYSKDGHMAGTEECHECMWENKQEPKTDSDCIRREDAIDAIMRYLGRLNRDFEAYRGTARIILNHLPPVQPKTKTGHWIMVLDRTDWYDATFKCSCCDREIIIPYDFKDDIYNDYPYCHCGAKMESEGARDES